MIRPDFDAEAHVYTVDGEVLPSVTQVLGAAGFLPDYSRVDVYYRERGSAAHAAIHLDILGQLDEESLDEHVGPFVDRFRLWAKQNDFEPVFAEGGLCDLVYRYAGTPDALGLVRGRLTVIDWKTGRFEACHAVQVAGGYLPLLEEAARQDALPVSLEELQQADVIVLPLDKAEPVAVPIPAIDVPDQRDIFRAALACYRWRQCHMKAA